MTYDRHELADLTGRFFGYASLFDIPDQGGDIVKRGAFDKSMRRKPIEQIAMLAHHNAEQPIGRWEVIKEDAKGLYVVGIVNKQVQAGCELLALLAQGGFSGLSIGFKNAASVKPASRGTASYTGRKPPVRILTQLDLWEISLVTFPMLNEARVVEVEKFSDQKRSFKGPDNAAKNLYPQQLIDADYIRQASQTLRVF